MSLPEHRLNVAALAHDNGAWRGGVDVDDFERLGDALGSNAGRVEVALDFSAGDDGRPHVTGWCSMAAEVHCTGCLRMEPVEVRSAIDFRVVATEAEVQALMPVVEAVVCVGESIPVTELIEDDLLLSVPESACADQSRCPHAEVLRAELGLPDDEAGRPNPFAALRTLSSRHGNKELPARG